MAASIGSQPFYTLDLKLSQCANEFGVAPCTATGSGNDKCYKKIEGCKDRDNYSESTKTIKLCSKTNNFPRGQNMIPCLVKVDEAPTTITGGRGIGSRAKLTFIAEDFPHNDQNIDPYVNERTYDTNQGTFFGKLLARDPYYQGREAISGFGILKKPFDQNDLSFESYIIEQISNADQNNKVKIVIKDVIKKLDSKRAVIPKQSTGELATVFNVGETVLNLKAGEGVGYTVNEYVSIGDEICLVTAINTDDLTVTRAQWGTDEQQHSVDSLVQICETSTNENIVDLIYRFATIPEGIPANHIIQADWNAERDEWVPSYNLTALIPKPTGVEILVNELCQLALLDIWDDAELQTLKLKASSPYRVEPITITDEDIVKNSMSVTDKPEERITRTWVRYGMENPLKKADDEGNIKRGYIAADDAKESNLEYNDIRAKVILTRWLRDTQADRDHAFSLANRLINRFSKSPKQFNFSMYYLSEKLPKTGDVIKISTSKKQDMTGAPQETIAQIMERKPNRKKGIYQFKALAYNAVVNAGTINTSITISSNQMNYNLWLAVGSPPNAVEIDVTINPAVIIGSVNASFYSFDIGAFAAGSVINLICSSAKIKGAGGKGGNAGGRLIKIYRNAEQESETIYYQEAEAGQQGGGAIKVPDGVTLNITNTSGLIASGNGGFNGQFQQRAYFHDQTPAEVDATGGDGGNGFDPGVGGDGYKPATPLGAISGDDGIDDEATAGLGYNPGYAIFAPNATVNIIDSGTINGLTNY